MYIGRPVSRAPAGGGRASVRPKRAPATASSLDRWAPRRPLALSHGLVACLAPHRAKTGRDAVGAAARDAHAAAGARLRLWSASLVVERYILQPRLLPGVHGAPGPRDGPADVAQRSPLSAVLTAGRSNTRGAADRQKTTERARGAPKAPAGHNSPLGCLSACCCPCRAAKLRGEAWVALSVCHIARSGCALGARPLERRETSSL